MDCPDAIMGLDEPGSSGGGSQKASSSSVSSSVNNVQTSPGDLRTVSIPEDLISKFLEVAKENSERNKETIGTLGGQLCNNKFCVTHLLIPNDSCTMDGVEDIWDIHDKEDLALLGWIHTHPAHSVFLSSLDMHNQYERQRMLPEVSHSLQFDSNHILSLFIDDSNRVQCQGWPDWSPEAHGGRDGRDWCLQPHRLPSSLHPPSALGRC